MSKMTRRYRDSIVKLRTRQGALHSRLEGLARAEAPDCAALDHLRKVAQSFRQEAHSLLVTLLFEDAPPALTDAADELLDVFSEAVDRAETLLAQIRQVN